MSTVHSSRLIKISSMVVMKQVRSVSKLLVGGILSLALGALGIQAAQAQRPFFLMDTACVNRGGSWGKNEQDISVGREVYTTVMYMNAGAAFTCRLPTVRSASLQLEFGISDNDNDKPPITVNVYLDGNQVASRTVSPGQRATLLVDISNRRSLALEAVCVRATNCSPYYSTVHFFKAQIQPSAASPGRRN